jgi:hypothetical protein
MSVPANVPPAVEYCQTSAWTVDTIARPVGLVGHHAATRGSKEARPVGNCKVPFQGGELAYARAGWHTSSLAQGHP